MRIYQCSECKNVSGNWHDSRGAKVGENGKAEMFEPLVCAYCGSSCDNIREIKTL